MNAHTSQQKSEVGSQKAEARTQAPLVVQCCEPGCRRVRVTEHTTTANADGWSLLSHGYCPTCTAVKLAEIRALSVPMNVAA